MQYLVSKSYIVGRFYGFCQYEDHCLGDGTQWRITSEIWLYRKEQKNPRASVIHNDDRHFLFVKGMPNEVEVEPVGLPRFVLETPIERRSNSEIEKQFDIPELTQDALEKWYSYCAKVNAAKPRSSHQ